MSERSRRSVSAVASAVALIAGVSGCASVPETRFYVLTPVALAEQPSDRSGGNRPIVGLRPVELPAQLDRPQIVTSVGGNVLHLAEFDRWAAPLGDNFTRVLAEDLARLVLAERVAVFPWIGSRPIDYEVAVEVSRFDGTLGGDCWLVAAWAVSRRGVKEATATGTSSYRESAGGSYAAMVSAQSRLVAALGRDIAAALEAAWRR
jgi:uncharacterized lipoprotein YmbA